MEYSWKGNIKFELEDDKLYNLYLNDEFIMMIKSSSPEAKALEHIFGVSLQENEGVIEKLNWSGRFQFEQHQNSPLFWWKVNGEKIRQFTANSPQAEYFEEEFNMDFSDLVAKEWKRAAPRVYPAKEKELYENFKKALSSHKSFTEQLKEAFEKDGIIVKDLPEVKLPVDEIGINKLSEELVKLNFKADPQLIKLKIKEAVKSYSLQAKDEKNEKALSSQNVLSLGTALYPFVEDDTVVIDLKPLIKELKELERHVEKISMDSDKILIKVKNKSWTAESAMPFGQEKDLEELIWELWEQAELDKHDFDFDIDGDTIKMSFKYANSPMSSRYLIKKVGEKFLVDCESVDSDGHELNCKLKSFDVLEDALIHVFTEG